jgi:outer membrane protein TolC
MKKTWPLIGVLAVAAAAQAADITLDDAIARALAASPAAVAADASYLSARADLWQGWGNVLPKAAVSYGANRYYDLEAMRVGSYTIPGYTPPLHYYASSAEVTQPLFAGGSLLWGVFSGRASARAGAAGRDEQRQQLVVDVATAYFGVLKAEGMKNVADTSLAASRHAEALARVQYETGALSRQEYLKAKVVLGQAETAAIAAEAGVANARLAFFHTVGTSPEPAATFAPVTLPVPRELPPPETLVDEALGRRADVARVNEESRKADLGVRTANAGWYPTVGAVASYDWSDANPPRRENWDPNANWTVGLSASWNLFDGFTTKANAARARAAAASARAAQDRIRDTVALDITQAYYEYRKQREMVTVAEETAAAADEEFKLQQQLYDMGGASMLELSDAQARYVEAQNTYIEAQYDFHIADYNLRRALGERLW